MSPAEQQFLDTVANQGTILVPYAKYVALAVMLWYVFLAVVAVTIFGIVIYQFVKMSRNF